MSWSVYRAVAIGTSHMERQLPCQDACQAWVSGNLLVAAVADGAGSASHSELGSELCVNAVVEGLKSFFESDAEQSADVDVLALSQTHLTDIINGVREKIFELAASNGLEPRDLACTLIGVVARLPGNGYFFHIGDGAGVAQFSDTTLPAVVSHPENGEYSNETWFLTHEAWKDHVRLTPFVDPIDTIAIMSDGSMPFALTKDRCSLFPGFISPVARYLKERSTEEGNIGLQALLESERTNSITNDDKTLVLAFANI